MTLITTFQCILFTAVFATAASAADTTLSKERVVLQTRHGDIHLAFYHKVAPESAANILKAAELGLYNTNHIFRVDKGFVAQIADINGGRTAPMNDVQKAVAAQTVPLEVHADVKHDKRGILSMARWDDPHSGTNSFSILLGPAPHLDMQYTVFGIVTKGIETLDILETLPTKTEGIFVMPLDRIEILSTYVYIAASTAADGNDDQGGKLCTEVLREAHGRADGLAEMLHDQRMLKLPA